MDERPQGTPTLPIEKFKTKRMHPRIRTGLRKLRVPIPSECMAMTSLSMESLPMPVSEAIRKAMGIESHKREGRV